MSSKNVADDEVHLQAFVAGEVVRWTLKNLFSDTRVVEARVYSVQHVGNKTKFVFCKP